MTRSPTSVGLGSWTSGVAAIIELMNGDRLAGRPGRGGRRHARRARDVRRRGAAAAADDPDAVALDELSERRRERLGLLGEDRLAVRSLQRQSRVRDAADGNRGELAEEADRVAHVLGAGRAVQADRVDLQRLERRQHGADVGAEQHLAAVGKERDAAHDRQHALSARNASRAPKTAALTSRMSCAVSMMIRSAPPRTSPSPAPRTPRRARGR